MDPKDLLLLTPIFGFRKKEIILKTPEYHCKNNVQLLCCFPLTILEFNKKSKVHQPFMKLHQCFTLLD
jgi:hypothetical protein